MTGAGATCSDYSWRHQSNNCVRGLEGALVRICGAGWKDFANTDRQLWMGRRPALLLKSCVFGGDHVWSGLHGTLNIVGDFPHVVCRKLLLVIANVHSFPLIH